MDQPYNEPKLNLKEALKLIFGSALVVLVVICGSYAFQEIKRAKRASSDKYTIVAIEQKCSSKNKLATQTLAEILNLSQDKPTNLYAFDVKDEEAKLNTMPFVKWANVKTISPGIVYVDYELRDPIALIQDYENVAIDSEKKLFQLRPIYLPKNLPEIVLGQKDSAFLLQTLESKELGLAFDILQFFQTAPLFKSMSLKKIDVSSAYHKKANREIVLEIKDGSDSFLVRLQAKNYQETIKKFFVVKPLFSTMKKKMNAKENFIVDLRVPKIAFIKAEKVEESLSG